MSKSKNAPAVTPSIVLQAPAAYDISAAMTAFTQAEVHAYSVKLTAAFTDRKRFETSRKSSGVDLPIVEKLNKVHAKLGTDKIMRAMMALGTNPEFINHSFSKDGTGNRFNIYAIDKAVDILAAVGGSKVANKVNLTALKAIVALGDTGLSRQLARISLSKQMRSSDAVVKTLERHTVSPVTAPTQTSSTMRILQALGLVTNRGDSRNAVYAFADTPQATAFKELLIAA